MNYDQHNWNLLIKQLLDRNKFRQIGKISVLFWLNLVYFNLLDMLEMLTFQITLVIYFVKYTINMSMYLDILYTFGSPTYNNFKLFPLCQNL